MNDTTPTTPAELLQSGAAAGTWALDPAASRIGFDAKHFWGLMTVRGTFERFGGSARVSDTEVMSASVQVDSGSVRTGIAKRDEHLRSADFFDANRYPTVVVTSGEIRLLASDRITVSGDLTAAGVTQPIAFDAVVTAAPDLTTATVVATVVLDRAKHGMTWSPLRMSAMTTTVHLRLTFTRAAVEG